MYNKEFYIEWKKWNNAFSIEKRKNKKLFIPKLINIKNLDQIKIQSDKNKIAFEDYDFNWKLSTNYWLENFYKIKWKDKEVILFDNHNHTYYFWYEAYIKWLIKKWSKLYHIDEHADTRDPYIYIQKDKNRLEDIFKYTNYQLNVWNYIIPAQKEWLIKEIIQIRSSKSLENYKNQYIEKKEKEENESIILNLDLDFFQKELDFIDYELKKEIILHIASKSSIITVASSPFFIDQDRAIKVFKDIFK